MARRKEDAHRDHERQAEEGDEVAALGERLDGGLAEIGDERDQRTRQVGQEARLGHRLGHALEQRGVGRAHVLEPGRRAGAGQGMEGTLDQPGAGGIERLERGQIDARLGTAARGDAAAEADGAQLAFEALDGR